METRRLTIAARKTSIFIMICERIHNMLSRIHHHYYKQKGIIIYENALRLLAMLLPFTI